MNRAHMVNMNDKTWLYSMFGVIVLGTALGNLAQTGLNSMMFAICEDLLVTPVQSQWFTTIYMFALGAVVPLSSYFMGKLTSKDLANLAFLIFLIGSVLCAVAQSFALLFVGRVVQAVAAGILMPFLLTFTVSCFPEGKKATAMGIGGIALGFAPNIGPSIGGVLVDSFGWRSFFWLLAGITLLVLLFSSICIQKKQDCIRPTKLDLVSFVIITLSCALILFGCSQASSVQANSFLIMGSIVTGFGLLGVFLHRQKHTNNPLICLDIFKSKNYTAGFWILSLLYASFMGVTLVIPLFVEGIWGGSALDAGLVLLPATVVALFVNPLSGFLGDKYGARIVSMVSGGFLVIGSVAMICCWETMPFWLLCLMQTARSVGVSGLIPIMSSWHLSNLEGRLVPSGSAFGLAMRQVFASIGTALMIFCVSESAFGFNPHSFQIAFAVSAIFAVICCILIVRRVK